MDDWTVCRICLQATDLELKRFSEGTFNLIPFENIYFQLMGKTMKKYPTFPAIICVNCENEMVQAYKFREKCIETEEKLENFLDEDISAVENSEITEIPKYVEVKKIDDKIMRKCLKNSENFEKKLSREKIEELKSRTIQCKRCNDIFRGLALFKIHRCFYTKKDSMMIAEEADDEVGSTIRKRKRDPIQKNYNCETCSKSFRSLNAFNAHMDKHRNIQRYACDYCDEKFSNWVMRRTHTYKKHLKTTYCQCNQCGKGFFTKTNLRNHILKDHLNNKFQCEKCGKTLNTKKGLANHKETHVSTKYTCNICGKQLNTRVTLNQHKKIHSGEKNYVCPVCSRAFTCNFSMKTHVRKLHPDEIHRLLPDGTIVNRKYLQKLAEEENL
ncbi:zinc finger protein 2 homolog [Sergentomyia squamirostris]